MSIIPAGRPGEVADVEGLPEELVEKLVRAANQPIRDAHVAFKDLAEKVLAAKELLSEVQPSLTEQEIKELEKALESYIPSFRERVLAVCRRAVKT